MFKIWHILLSEEDTEDVTRVPLYIMYQFYCFPYSFVPYCFTSVVSSASKNQFDSKSLLLSNDMCLYSVHADLSKGFGLAVPCTQKSKLNKNKSYALHGSMWSYVRVTSFG